jgi:hypothetical protein
MGYTHYWDFKNNNLEQKDFDKILKDVKVIDKYFQDNDIISENAGCIFDDVFVKLEGNSVAYRGWLVGNELEEIDAISLNGVEEGGLSHENLFFKVGENTWNFCKTARKPYDLIVTLVLMTIKYKVRGTNISSDGGNEDWEHAFKLYETIFPKRKVFFKFNEKGDLKIINAKKATEQLLTKGVAI